VTNENIILLTIGIVTGVLLALRTVVRRIQKKRTSQPSVDQHDYQRIPLLLTPTETRFYHVLIAALPTEYTCMTQVALNRLIKVQKPRFGAAWRDPRWNRIAQKSIDFVVVRRSDLRVMVLIELDDATHQQAHRQQRDTFLDTVCAHINLPILHIPVQPEYQRTELQMRLLGYLTAK
jgi:hypothetical protein